MIETLYAVNFLKAITILTILCSSKEVEKEKYGGIFCWNAFCITYYMIIVVSDSSIAQMSRFDVPNDLIITYKACSLRIYSARHGSAFLPNSAGGHVKALTLSCQSPR